MSAWRFYAGIVSRFLVGAGAGAVLGLVLESYLV